jgi:5-hydroxyisourate hydrolase/2-oxo-4-hydroxy-4-carboxy-5-ureidoimidazoline decarboxylase
MLVGQAWGNFSNASACFSARFIACTAVVVCYWLLTAHHCLSTRAEPAFIAPAAVLWAAALQEKFSSQAFAELSKGEQAAGLASADPLVFEELAAANKAYKARHGFIFIICASGKSAAEMLAAIKQRLPNSPYVELGAAAREQMKITELRLDKILAAANAGSSSSPTQRAHVRTGQLANHLIPGTTAAPAAAAAAATGHGAGPLRSPITTHVLDTALGRPAPGLPIVLRRLMEGSQRVWDCLAAGVTDADGRIGNLLPPAAWVAPGHYQMVFDTGAYLKACR